MKINLIIGAGQIGSRHLQGMLKWQGNQNIYVVDPSAESLSVAESRAQEIEHNHQIHFLPDLSEVPGNLDLVIVATSANVREKVLNTILGKFKIQFLVLEKVLFQELDAYNRINDLIINTGTKTWVNHPRRMVPGYIDLKAEILGKTSKRLYSVIGNNWGLGCNGLHFIDLFCFFSNSLVKSIDTDWLDKNIATSKRAGFIEFTGALKGELTNGDKFIIGSFDYDASSTIININTDQALWVIQEAPNAKLSRFEKSISDQTVISNFKIEFQSEFTTRLCDDLFLKGDTILPTFDEAFDTHKHFIKSLLEFSNAINNTNEKTLPIT
jgi:hypothetical protein